MLFVYFEDDESSYFVTQIVGALRRHLINARYQFLSVTASRHNRGDRSLLKAVLSQTVDFVLLMYSSPDIEAMVKETGVDGSIAVPFDRQGLADFLGVHRTALSRTISKLVAAGRLTCRKNVFGLNSEADILI